MKSQFSQLWYRVETLRPRLRGHVRLSRHRYWGRIWYVILDPASGRVHRFTVAAYMIIGLMDGRRTIAEIWNIACEKLGSEVPSQDELIHLLGQLHSADVLQCDTTPDAVEIFDRFQAHDFSRKIAPLMNPLAVKIPLFDPERLLVRLLPLVRPLFHAGGGLLWLAVVGTALVLAGQHWPELTTDILDRITTPQNIILLWLIFPFVKILHELGHGLAATNWEGEVHELGVMFLVFTPVPYVDVSTSSAFRSRLRRILVASAGMMVEVFIAALALVAWVNTEPGLPRSIAYNIILIAGVSTILFNANPLLRFDGYYIFSDLLELPNLSQRATQYILYLIERYLYHIDDLEEPADSRQERVWLLTYALASLVYRIMIVIGILFVIAQKSLLLGAVFAALTSISMIFRPAYKGMNYLLHSPRLTRRRHRAVITIGTIAVVSITLIALIPFPLRTQVEGVVWLPEKSFVRAETAGFAVQLEADSGSAVYPGQPLAVSDEPLLQANIAVLTARIEELEARLRALESGDRVQMGILKEQLSHQQAALARAMERMDQLTTKGKESGRFVVPQSEDLAGRFLHQGETIGYVITDEPVNVRVVVPQQQINLVRSQTLGVHVRLAKDLDRIVAGPVVREVPSAEEHLPSKVLGTEGGGQAAVDPRDTSGTKTFSRMFQFDVELPLRWNEVAIGERVHVRFEHGLEPLIYRWLRGIRQLFLSKLDV